MIIETRGLGKSYGSIEALKHVDLAIEAGGVVGLLGPNGAGKTTLVEILEGLREPSRGRVSVLGMDPGQEPRALRERIGVQLQSTAVPQELTTLETLRLFAAFFRRSLRPADVLERVGLAHKAGSRNSTLSGGQRQLLALALALVNDPELLLLDEPTAGLDPQARQAFHAHISELRTSKRTVLLSTHRIDEAERLCDRVLILRSGEIVADGAPFQLVSRAPVDATLSMAVGGEFDPAPLLQAGAVEGRQDGGGRRFTARDPAAAVRALGQVLGSPGTELLDVQMNRPSLEDVYLELMGSPAFRYEERP